MNFLKRSTLAAFFCLIVLISLPAQAAIETEFSLAYSPDPLLSGASATFTLSYIAAEDSSACPKPSLTLALSEYISFTTASADGEFIPDGSGVTGGSVFWADLPTFNQNKAGEVIVTGLLEEGLPPNEPIFLDAEMMGQNGEDCGGAIFMPPANPAPVLELTKESSRAIVQPNQSINYTVELLNSGNQSATNISLVDELPAEVEFVSASGEFTYTPGAPATVEWDFAELEVNSPVSRVVTVVVNNFTPVGTIITNTVTAEGQDQSGGSLDPAFAEVTTEVASKPLLVISKTAQDTVLPGGELNYEIDYANEGDTNATNVTVIDTYSEFINQINSVSAGGVVNEEARTITWTLGEVPPGQSGSFAYSATVNLSLITFTRSTIALTPDRVENTVIINAENAAIDSATHSAGVVEPTPSLDLVKTGPENADAGARIGYLLEFSNSGSAPSLNTIVEDFLPQQCESVEVSDGGIYDPATNSARWNIGLLGINQGGAVSISCGLEIGIVNGTTITNTGSVSSLNGSPDTSQVVTIIRSQPVLQIIKTGAPDPVPPGATLEYVYEIINSGNANATGLSIEDFLDQNVVYLSDSFDGIYSSTENKVTWNVDTLLAGQSLQISMQVRVLGDLIGNVSLNNNVTVESNETQAVGTQETIQVATSPSLILEKTSTETVVQPGDTITYTLAYQNIGSNVATGVVLTDDLPLNTTYQSSSNSGEFNDGKVTWALGDIPVAGNGAVTLTVSVNSPLENGTILANSATITATETQPVTAKNSITVSSQPVLFLDKTADRNLIEIGDQVTFNLNYGNTGNANATNVLLTDTLPAVFAFVSASAGGVFSGGVVRWPADDLNVGSNGTVSLVAQLVGPSNDNDKITNVASIVSDQTPLQSASVELVVSNAPVLALTKTVDRNIVQAGDEVTFIIGVANTGNAFATEVVLTDEIPSGLSFVSASEGFELNGNTVTWRADQLPVNTSVSVLLTLSVDESVPNNTLISNTASIVSAQTSSQLARAQIVVQSLPNLTLTKEASTDFVEAGSNVNFALTYKNTGTASADNLVLEDSLSKNFTFVSATGGGIYDDATRTITWTDPGVGAGAGGQVEITLKVNADVPDDTKIENFATISADRAQAVTASASVVVNRTPVLRLTKTANREFVTPGDRITYTLSFTNVGNATAMDLILEDPIPKDTTLVSAPGATEIDGILFWEFPELPVNATGSVNMEVEVDESARLNSAFEPGSTIFNSASIDSSNANVATASVSIPVQLEPKLDLAKESNADFVEPGQQVSFTITFGNSGNADALATRLIDRIPNGMEFLSASPGFVFDGVFVRWDIGNVEPGVTGEVFIIMEVKPDVADGTIIRNFAEFNADNSAIVLAMKEVSVQATPALKLTKTADTQFANPGETITYELNYSNQGNTTASEVVLEDAIPAFTILEQVPPNATLEDGKVVWRFASLAVGASGSVSLQLKVEDADQEGGVKDGDVIRNVATLDANNAPAVSAANEVTVEASPLFELEKTTTSEVVDAGKEVSYSIVYRNTGNGPADNVLLLDILPQDTTYVSSTGGTLDGNTVIWNIGRVSSGAEGSVALTVRVNEGTPNGTSILNTAQVSSDQTVPVSDSVTIAVRALPLLSLEKTSDVDIAGPGELITFTLDYLNNGNATATNLVLADVVPPLTEFVSATGGGVIVGGAVIWAKSEFLAGDSGSVNMTVRVSAEAKVHSAGTNGSTIYNIATIAASNAGAKVAEKSVVIQQYPILGLEKSSDVSVVEPGDIINYAMDVSNSGNLSATNVTLTDPVPAYTTFLSATGGGELINGEVVWELDELPPGYTGSVSFSVEVDDPISDRDDVSITINNTATLDAGDQAPSVTASVKVDVEAQAIATLSKRADVSFAQPGQLVNYLLEFANTGNLGIRNATLFDALPANSQFVSASNNGVLENGLVIWSLGELAGGSNGSVTLTVEIDELVEDGTVIRNIAALDSAGQVPPISVQNEIFVEATADFTLEKEADKPLVQAGDSIIYTISYANIGNAIAVNPILVESIPENTELLSVSDGGVVVGNNIEWMLADLLPGETGTVSVEVKARDELESGARIQNTATLDADNASTVSASDSVFVYKIVISPVQLGISVVGTPDLIEAGSQATFIVTYQNLTDTEALNPDLEGIVPVNSEFVSASNGGVVDRTVTPARVRWSLPTLPGNGEGQVSFVVQHIAEEPEGSPARQVVMDETGELMFSIGGFNADNAAAPVVDSALVRILAPPPPIPPYVALPVPASGFYSAGLMVIVLLLMGLFRLSRQAPVARGARKG